MSKKKIICALFCFTLFLTPVLLNAEFLDLEQISSANLFLQDNADLSLIKENAYKSSSFLTTILRFSVFLFFILIISLFLYTRFKKYSIRKKFQNKNIKILSTYSFTHKQALYLIEIADQIMLVGATDHNIGLLYDFKNPETKSKLLDTVETGAEEKEFNNYLQHFIKKIAKDAPEKNT